MRKKSMKSKGTPAGKMKAGALKKGGGAKLGRGGAKLGPSAGNSLAPPRPAGVGGLGAAGTKLGGKSRDRARDRRLQNAQL